MCYEAQWQRKRSRAWRDSRHLLTFSPDLQKVDRPAEAPSAAQQTNGIRHPGTATLDNYIEVAWVRPRELPMRRLGPSNDVESAARGGPASKGSAPPLRSEVVRAWEHISGMPCNICVA